MLESDRNTFKIYIGQTARKYIKANNHELAKQQTRMRLSLSSYLQISAILYKRSLCR